MTLSIANARDNLANWREALKRLPDEAKDKWFWYQHDRQQAIERGRAIKVLRRLIDVAQESGLFPGEAKFLAGSPPDSEGRHLTPHRIRWRVETLKEEAPGLLELYRWRYDSNPLTDLPV